MRWMHYTGTLGCAGADVQSRWLWNTCWGRLVQLRDPALNFHEFLPVQWLASRLTIAMDKAVTERNALLMYAWRLTKAACRPLCTEIRIDIHFKIIRCFLPFFLGGRSIMCHAFVTVHVHYNMMSQNGNSLWLIPVAADSKKKPQSWITAFREEIKLTIRNHEIILRKMPTKERACQQNQWCSINQWMSEGSRRNMEYTGIHFSMRPIRPELLLCSK